MLPHLNRRLQLDEPAGWQPFEALCIIFKTPQVRQSRPQLHASRKLQAVCLFQADVSPSCHQRDDGSMRSSHAMFAPAGGFALFFVLPSVLDIVCALLMHSCFLRGRLQELCGKVSTRFVTPAISTGRMAVCMDCFS